MRLDDKIVARIDEFLAKGEGVLASASQSSASIPHCEPDVFNEWRSQAQSLLESVFQKNHAYVRNFAEQVTEDWPERVKSGQGILRAVREDILGGHLSSISTLISAEIFDDFLEMAAHLLDSGYKDPAASLTGAVLEDGLRRIAAAHGITTTTGDGLNSLNQKCAKAGIYNKLVYKKLDYWREIRNNADHGNFAHYSEEDVTSMVAGVQSFLSDHV